MPSSEEFDAYHKWLGISPGPRPPHLYQLLGIRLFEDDAEVIEAAADRQMAHVKAFASGPHSARSQALLNELARARVVLLNPAKKTAYDRGFKERLTGALSGAASDATRTEAVAAVARQGATNAVSRGAAETLSVRPWANDLDVTPDRIFRSRRRTFSVERLVAGVLLVGLSALALFVVVSQLSPKEATMSSVRRGRPTARVNPVSSEPRRPQRRRPLASSQNQIARPAREASERDDREREPAIGRIETEDDAPPATVADAAPAAEATQAFDLDLTKRKQRFILSQPVREVRVKGLSGASSPATIKPADGLLSETEDVIVSIDSIREVVIKLRLKVSDDVTSVLADYYVLNDAAKEVPFTPANLKSICASIIKDGRAAASTLDNMQRERDGLERWVKSPVMKPLADVAPAKARVMEIDSFIPDQTKLVEGLNADLAVAQELARLAEELQRDAALELSIVE